MTTGRSRWYLWAIARFLSSCQFLIRQSDRQTRCTLTVCSTDVVGLFITAYVVRHCGTTLSNFACQLFRTSSLLTSSLMLQQLKIPHLTLQQICGTTMTGISAL